MKRILAWTLLLSCLPAVVSAAPYWSPETQLTNSSSWAHNEDEAVGPTGTLHMLTLDNRTTLPAAYYQRKPDSSPNGSSFVVLSSQTGGVQTNRSVLCTDNGQGVYAVWEEYYGLDIHIYFRRSLDDGLTWQDAVLVAGSTTAAAQATYPSIMVDKGLLHLLWYDQYTGQVLYRKGPADGSTLSTPLALNVSGQAEAPNLAISGNGIVAYWQDPSLEKIKYVQSADSGESWFNAQTLGNADNNNCSAPKLVIDANQNLYAVWSQPDQVVFQKVDAVLGALSPMTVSTQPGTSFQQPTLAVWGGKIVVAWIFNESGNMQIRMNTSSDSGKTWGTDAGFDTRGSVQRPRLVADRGNFHLFYDKGDAGPDRNQVWHVLRDDLGPLPVKVKSSSHPNPDNSGNNLPMFSWTANDNPGGIGLLGYAVTFDTRPDTDPGTTIQYGPDQTSQTFSTSGNGVYYFHIRALDQLMNPGDVTHFQVGIDNHSLLPEDQVWIAPAPVRNGRFNLHFFLTKSADIKLDFFSSTGLKITSQTLSGTTGINRLVLDIRDWVNGTYFYRVTARAQDNGDQAMVKRAFGVLQ
jgi:hypothetical protein